MCQSCSGLDRMIMQSGGVVYVCVLKACIHASDSFVRLFILSVTVVFKYCGRMIFARRVVFVILVQGLRG